MEKSLTCGSDDLSIMLHKKRKREKRRASLLERARGSERGQIEAVCYTKISLPYQYSFDSQERSILFLPTIPLDAWKLK
jgi:hypothetical protein